METLLVYNKTKILCNFFRKKKWNSYWRTRSLTIFNAYYANIVEKIPGRIPSKLGALNPSLTDSKTVKRTIDSYKKTFEYKTNGTKFFKKSFILFCQWIGKRW